MILNVSGPPRKFSSLMFCRNPISLEIVCCHIVPPRDTVSAFQDPSDSEEDLPKQGSIGNARPITGLSRRTKASSPNASRSSYLNAKGTSEASWTPNYGAERKSSSTEALRKPSSQTQILCHPSSEKIFSPITLHLRFQTNSYLRPEAPSNGHVVEQRVEWQVSKILLPNSLQVQPNFMLNGSSVGRVNATQPACSNAASADSMMSAKTEPVREKSEAMPLAKQELM
ncbi:hypothetical protein FH972_002659 [Carpinus fangiana]|uniref:Uncharacterized protein n=1 Tax=Carpinus fangiana TaxID=176857 RepID=A0A5N6QHX8_9ROSI|nr:hypothetical protein FH972_002659 [Carpinus fangiana]